jgi:hypothetical protein
MNKKLNIAFALLAGLASGLLSRYIAPPLVFAQDQASISKDIRAQSFTLVDSSDHTVGTFTAEPISGPTYRPPAKNQPQMRIVLRDSTGCEIWHAGATPC